MRKRPGDSEPNLNPLKETQFFLNVHCGTQLQSGAPFLSDELQRQAARLTTVSVC